MNDVGGDFERGEQGDDGLDLCTEQDLVDRLVEAVTEEDLYGVLVWIKRMEERGWIGHLNDSRERGQLPTSADALWLELVRPWALELLENPSDPKNEDEKVVKYLLASTEDEAGSWIALNLGTDRQTQDEDSSRNQRSRSLPTAGPSTGRAHSLPSQYTPLGAGKSSSSARVEQRNRNRETPPLVPTPQPHLGFIDLTDSRTPSPEPKLEPVEQSLSSLTSTSRTQSRNSSTRRDKGKGRASDSPDRHSAKAHLRIDNLPIRYTRADLRELFSDMTGIVDASDPTLTEGGDASWGLITFKNLMLAQHAYANKIGKVAPGGVRGLQMKIYAESGEPIPPHVAVEPIAAVNGIGSNGASNGESVAQGGGANGERYTVGFSGGASAGGERGQIYSAQDAARTPLANGNSNGGGRGWGGGNLGGGGGGGPPNGNFSSRPGSMFPPPRFFPRPRVPYIFTAAELARRVFVGSLPCGITEDEVGRIFSEKARVTARILRVKNAPDGSHAIAFVQHPDSITAEFAIKNLHGQVYDGHLLQVEHVNELAHRWLFSLTLYGFPAHWGHRDVSDFLISTIGSFAGLRVTQPYGRGGVPNVRVELRYKTELCWAAKELHGLVVENESIRAEAAQPKIRAEIERERAYARLSGIVANGGNEQQGSVVGLPAPDGGATAAYNPYDPPAPAPSNGYDPNHSSMAPPPLPNGGGSTPSGRSRPMPPPPPPPPAKRARTEEPLRPASLAVPEEAEINPFSPKWMLGGGS